jgi:hypothetical protein
MTHLPSQCSHTLATVLPTIFRQSVRSAWCVAMVGGRMARSNSLLSAAFFGTAQTIPGIATLPVYILTGPEHLPVPVLYQCSGQYNTSPVEEYDSTDSILFQVYYYQYYCSTSATRVALLQ